MQWCYTLTALSILTGVQVTSAFHWNSDKVLPDNANLTLCKGQSVTLPWRYFHEQAEHITAMEWHFTQEGGHADTMLAARSHGQFLPEPNNKLQVNFNPNAGIQLVNMSTGDSGTYSVHIVFNLHGSLVTQVRKAHVQVTDTADVVKNGHLVAAVQPGATLLNTTGDYHIMLACSKVNPQWRQITQILWTTPSHQVLPSTLHDSHGVSYLAVPNPVKSGVYSCHIDQSSPCITTNYSATLTVDGMEARLSLLEGQLQAMRSKETALESELQTLHSENQALKQKLENSTHPVIFEVRVQTQTTSNQPLHFNEVAINEGNGFNPLSGKFMAPVNGTYVFHMTLVSMNPSSDNSNIIAYLVVDGQKLVNAMTSRVTGYYNTGSVDLVKQLSRGQHVWVVNDSNGQHHFTFTVHLSGFLITAGP